MQAKRRLPSSAEMQTGGMLGAGVRLLRLPANDRRRVLEAAAALTRVSLELRLSPSRQGRLGTLRNAPSDERVGAEGLREAARVGRTVARAADRLPWHPTCLRQALAAQRMLRRRGIPSRLHLGVADATAGEAHAWVTVAGHPVVGQSGAENLVPLAAFDG
jgi:Transglutaminase-like superfamily